MPLASPEESRVPRKVQKACVRCRTMKIKCSGTEPCVRCAKKKRRCQFAVEESRVPVPERLLLFYLRELERRKSPVLYHGRTSISAPTAPRSRFSHNPLVEYSFAASPDGRFWYLGPSSSWSFCRRVLALLGEQVPDAKPPDPWNLDGMAFKLKWWPLPLDETPDLTDLPPMDYGLYLLQTVRFNFGPLFYIIDETTFTRTLYDFYYNPEECVGSMRAWFAQYLLIIEFGKAFLAPCRLPNAPPEGYQYAARAMALMPDMSGVLSNPLQCIEALALAALYFQSVDMRVAAFNHIGFTLRTCIIEGIHRHVPEELKGEEVSRRCQTVFWIIYMLDREFSASVGAPSPIRDEDITVKLFVNGSVDEQTLTLHVRLARLNARILATIYGVGSEFDGTLINDTQSLFRDLADLSQDLNDLLSRTLAIPLSPTIISLLSCCVESAQTVLQTLRTLADSDLLEASLPFQIEDAFASTFLPYVIHVIAPPLAPQENLVGNAEFVMERLVRKGNLAAPLRRDELECLKRILGRFTSMNDGITDENVANVAGHELRTGTASSSGFGLGSEQGQEQQFDWDIFAVDATIGLEPSQLLDLADQLDVQGIMDYAVS
ncbi:uncharacterized protein BDV17DRAFT_298002 [Aspergillus undulatus]|uniref:uncharacterized protein n=1 Tax=Aspergillus undulatus TaxID=1810928 RepID=UPI003CCCC6CF